MMNPRHDTARSSYNARNEREAMAQMNEGADVNWNQGRGKPAKVVRLKVKRQRWITSDLAIALLLVGVIVFVVATAHAWDWSVLKELFK